MIGVDVLMVWVLIFTDSCGFAGLDVPTLTNIALLMGVRIIVVAQVMMAML